MSLVTDGVSWMVWASIVEEYPKPSSAVTLWAVTMTSSTDSAEFKTKDSLDVSPTTRLVVTSSDRRPAADTLIVYGLNRLQSTYQMNQLF